MKMVNDITTTQIIFLGLKVSETDQIYAMNGEVLKIQILLDGPSVKKDLRKNIKRVIL
jgi:hypothetical protein